MISSRTKNTKRNIIWSYADYFISFIFQFVSRTIIVQVLGSQYLGLSSLFTSILQVLNMAELGFSSAVVYNMYKPIAENDVNGVNALLAFYRNIYRIVGSLILVVGVGFTPFLPLLIKGSWPEDINIYILYLLYLLNTVVSYFLFAYKSSLLNAMQRMDLTKIAYSIVNILQCVLQLVSVLVFKNYYAFVVVLLLGSVFKNILAAYFAKKYYPQYECRGCITKAVKISIVKRVKGLLICKISGVTYTTFDSIILSTIFGLVSVAVYANYLTVYAAVTNVIILIRHAMQASIGNSVASEDVSKNYKDVLLWQFLFSVIAIWCSVCLLCLFQPFMKIWMGDDMMLTMVDVIILSVLFLISTVQHAFYLYLSGTGMWWELRWAYIWSTVCNLILNVGLCKLWGTTGIILATFIAKFVFGFVWQCQIIFKNYFKKSTKEYHLKHFVYFSIGILIAVITYYLCSMVRSDDLFGLFERGIICVVVPPSLMFICFRKMDVFKKSKLLIMNVIKN